VQLADRGAPLEGLEHRRERISRPRRRNGPLGDRIEAALASAFCGPGEQQPSLAPARVGFGDQHDPHRAAQCERQLAGGEEHVAAPHHRELVAERRPCAMCGTATSRTAPAREPAPEPARDP